MKKQLRFECVRDPPPAPGDELCILLTGRTEADLVDDILSGKYAEFLANSSRKKGGKKDNGETLEKVG